jgi:hypothetical protein
MVAKTLTRPDCHNHRALMWPKSGILRHSEALARALAQAFGG